MMEREVMCVGHENMKIFRWSELCDDVRVILISSRNLNFDSLDYKPAADEQSRKC